MHFFRSTIESSKEPDKSDDDETEDDPVTMIHSDGRTFYGSCSSAIPSIARNVTVIEVVPRTPKP